MPLSQENWDNWKWKTKRIGFQLNDVTNPCKNFVFIHASCPRELQGPSSPIVISITAHCIANCTSGQENGKVGLFSRCCAEKSIWSSEIQFMSQTSNLRYISAAKTLHNKAGVLFSYWWITVGGLFLSLSEWKAGHFLSKNKNRIYVL